MTYLRTAACAALVGIVAGCGATAPIATSAPELTPLPRVVVDGWAFLQPFPLPDGAVALHLDAPPIPDSLDLPDGAVFGCHMAQLTITMTYDPDAPPDQQINGGDGPVWPTGYSARLYNGRAEIVSPLGAVVLRDGETQSFGGGLGADDRYHVCEIATLPQKVDTPSPT